MMEIPERYKEYKNYMKKYELTDETIKIENKTLYRIRALKDIPGYVKAGELGGFVQSEHNLSHYGGCWIYDNACVYDNARVRDNAQIQDNAQIYGNAIIRQTAFIKDNASINEHAHIGRGSYISGHAKITDNTSIQICMITDNAYVHGDCKLYCCTVRDKVEILGNIEISDAEFGGEAIIQRPSDYYLIQHPTQYNTILTIFKGKDGNKYISPSRGKTEIKPFVDFMNELSRDNPAYRSLTKYIDDYFAIKEKELKHEENQHEEIELF